MCNACCRYRQQAFPSLESVDSQVGISGCTFRQPLIHIYYWLGDFWKGIGSYIFRIKRGCLNTCQTASFINLKYYWLITNSCVYRFLATIVLFPYNRNNNITTSAIIAEFTQIQTLPNAEIKI